MICRFIRVAAAVAALLLIAQPGAFAQPTPGQATPAASAAQTLPFVSPIFGDNMVLQRGKPDTIWGWSDPGDQVRVQIAENTATGTACPTAAGRSASSRPRPADPTSSRSPAIRP